MWRIAACALAMSGLTATALEVAVPSAAKAAIGRYCLDCHDADAKKGNLDLGGLLSDDLGRHSVEWERVVRRLAARQMPPIGRDRPAEREFDRLVATLASSLDTVAAKSPDPGRPGTFRRLNRTEYRNAIRDLLGVEIDATTLLPKDDASHGFDNMAGGDLSPTLLQRYISAAEKISRIAVGASIRRPTGETYRLKPDLTQEEHVAGLPPGTRGGALIRHTFPRDGEYEIQIRLTRDRNEVVEGLHEVHELEVLLDRRTVARFKVEPPKGDRDFEKVDAHLKARVGVDAGLHQVGVTFVKNPSSLVETQRDPFQARYNMHRHPRLSPAVYQVSVTGPHGSQDAGPGSGGGKSLGSHPRTPDEERSEAERVLRDLMRRAYRRPVVSADLAKPMRFYLEAKETGGHEAGIGSAISAILVSPEFLFRIERDPVGVPSGTVHKVGDLELASRLSFFLWSSIPDDELLSVAERGMLHRPRVLEKQVRRMLADPRSSSLVENFAAQWLHLRNLDSFTPDLRLFPDFDDNLREAFRRETELHFEELIREDRDVLDLIRCDHTFLNERLARHYGIPHIHGSRFRRVALEPGSPRGGLLRQGSVLTVTSYATRTSPVMRGHWVLGNLLGTPPPPPPANIPNLKENTVSDTLPMRARLSAHRANAACAGCHDLMDPVGFALENFDAIGRWRLTESGLPIDAGGGLSDGSRFTGVTGLEDALLKHPDLFVGTMTEKLLAFALGRGIREQDAPAIRRIVRDTRREGNRFSSIVIGIVNSNPFTLSKTP